MGNVDDEVFECLMAGYDLSALTYKIISIVNRHGTINVDKLRELDTDLGQVGRCLGNGPFEHIQAQLNDIINQAEKEMRVVALHDEELNPISGTERDIWAFDIEGQTDLNLILGQIQNEMRKKKRR